MQLYVALSAGQKEHFLEFNSVVLHVLSLGFSHNQPVLAYSESTMKTEQYGKYVPS